MMRFLAAVMCAGCLLTPLKAEPAKYVALTFDDGPSGTFTETLLEGLGDRNVKATFFLCGYRLKQYPELAQRMFQEGHEIGCHGYSHSPMQNMSRRQVAQEISDTQALLPEGCRIRFLRPPGGLAGDGVRDVSQVRGLSILSWSVDPKDWATQDQKAVEQRILSRVKDGDVVLMHDMTQSSVQAALNVVDVLQRQGYEFLTVSELAKRRQTRLEPGQTYCRFPPKPETAQKAEASPIRADGRQEKLSK